MTTSSDLIDTLIEEIDQRNAAEAVLIDDLRQAWAGLDTGTDPVDPPVTGDNLATPNFIAGALRGTSAEGWSGGEGVWRFNGDGTVTAEPVNGSTAIATIEPKTGLNGKTVRFEADMTSPDGASGELFVRASVQGGGSGKQLFLSSDVAVVPGTRLSLKLGEVPASNKRIEILLRRERGATGTLVLSRIAIVEA